MQPQVNVAAEAAARLVGPREIASGRVVHNGREYVVVPKNEYDDLLEQNRQLALLVQTLLAQNQRLDEQNRALATTVDAMNVKQQKLEKEVSQIANKTKFLNKVAIVAGAVAVTALIAPAAAGVAALL